jgi:hypothetical protein
MNGIFGTESEEELHELQYLLFQRVKRNDVKYLELKNENIKN